MAKASDNLFPYVHLVPAAAPAAPAAGAERVYLDSADGKMKRKNSSGTVTTIEGGAGSGDASWTAPTFVNSWVNYDTTVAPAAGYRKDGDGRVWLRGLVKNGTINATIFTLPAGYRPLGQHTFEVTISGGRASIQVKADGTVVGLSNSATFTYLDGVVFWTT